MNSAEAAQFFDDHWGKSIDSNAVTDAAIERYEKNETTTSSWIELGVDSVRSKAGGGTKVAHVFQGKQQPGVRIKARQ